MQELKDEIKKYNEEQVQCIFINITLAVFIDISEALDGEEV